MLDQMFATEEEELSNQGLLSLDDGGGLRVVHADFQSESKFDWDLFSGFNKLRVLTYSASADAIVRMLDSYDFDEFECIFGYEGTLQNIRTILAFQKTVIGDTRAAIMGLPDERHIHILEKVHEGKARFRVLRNYIAHAKLYLLSADDGRHRVIVGSANLSERAFSGRQPETLVSFDDSEEAWQHYNKMYREIRDSASDSVEIPEERITRAEIDIADTPVMDSKAPTLIIEPPRQEGPRVPVQIQKVEKVAAVLGPSLSAVIPPSRNGRQSITPDIRRQIARVSLVKSVEEVESTYFHIDRLNSTASLSGKPFPLTYNDESVRNDAGLLVNYFENYSAFEGDVPRHQRDYFILMSWFYFSPLMSDLRSLALIEDSDIIRYPQFCVVFGKSNCGKTTLIDTLMMSMFRRVHTIEKRQFTTAKLRGLQETYRRFPVVFDDIGKTAFNAHGKDMIKDELQPNAEEFPCFTISMNNDSHSFPDEVVKRSLMIYTTTALPQYDEERRQQLFAGIQAMRKELTGDLYKRYLVEVMDALQEDKLPDDWLALSSGVLSGIIGESLGHRPSWCRQISWNDYAAKRYDRVKAALQSLLRPASYADEEGSTPRGWTLDSERIIVWEPQDAFGRRSFGWEDVPSTLIDSDTTQGNVTFLVRSEVEGFLGHRLHAPGRFKGLRRLFGR